MSLPLACSGSRSTKRRPCKRCRRLKLKCDLQLPTCGSCIHHSALCEWESPGANLQIATPDQYNTALKYLIENLGELYVFFHPNNLAALLESADRQKDDEKVFLWAMIDALASLGALYLEDARLSELFYASAKKNIDSLASNQVEEFIARTVLVHLFDPPDQSLMTDCIIQATVALHHPTRYKG